MHDESTALDMQQRVDLHPSNCNMEDPDEGIRNRCTLRGVAVGSHAQLIMRLLHFSHFYYV